MIDQEKLMTFITPQMTRNARIFSACLILLHLCVLLTLPSPARGEDKPPAHPCPLDADLWLLAGQSNMQGAGEYKNGDVPRDDPRIVMFNMNNVWMPARDPLHRPYDAAAPVHHKIYLESVRNNPQKQKELSAQWDAFKALSQKGDPPGGVGPGLPFARHLIEYTRRPVGLIPCAHGGTSMAQWDPARKDQGDESLYGAMLNRIKMVGGARKIKGLLWYQGESDARHDPEHFKARLLKFIDSLRADLGRPDLPIIYIQIGRLVYIDQAEAKGWEQVREAQRLAAQERRNVFMVTGIDLPLHDIIHITAEGQERLGRRMAEVALTEIYHMPGHAMPIGLASVMVDPLKPAVIRVRFSGVSGRLKAPGRSIQFALRTDDKTHPAPPIFRVDFDPEDPAGIQLVAALPITAPVSLICGPGLDPYLNIVDEKDIPVPAFGPVEVPLGK